MEMLSGLQNIYELFETSDFRVSTDTRKIEEGVLFFALKGDNFDGNQFALKALENGARYAIVDERYFEDDRIIQVHDVLKCLQELACLHRRKMGTKVLGIGGSNGKTTTKELIVSVLSLRFNTHFTHGNLNNHIGVPLTLLQLRPEHEILVLELGANKKGDIAELCLIAEPDMGIITNIGKEHLAGFGDIEGVAKAESELFDYLLKHNGYAFVNSEDIWLDKMGKRLPNTTLYGIHMQGISELHVVPSISFKYHGEVIDSVLMGAHNFENIVAAISIANYFKISVQQIKKGIQSYIPSNNRSQIIRTENGNTILMDAYNANPSSVEMALKTFDKMEGDKIVLMGDMFELGVYEHEEHQNIAELCGKLNFEKCFLIGIAFDRTEVHASNIFKFKTKEDALKVIRQHAYKNSVILIKGSRGMKMEDFLKEF